MESISIEDISPQPESTASKNIRERRKGKLPSLAFENTQRP